MKNEDVQKILKIMKTADGGCQMCALDLIERFGQAFPEHQGLCLNLLAEDPLFEGLKMDKVSFEDSEPD